MASAAILGFLVISGSLWSMDANTGHTIGYGYCDARKSKNRIRVLLETVVFFVFKSVVHKFSWLVVEIQYYGTCVWYNKDIKKQWYYFQPTVLSSLKRWVEC